MLRNLVRLAPAPIVQWAGRRQHTNLLIKRLAGKLGGAVRSGPTVVPHGHLKGLVIDPGGANPGYAMGTTEPLIQDTLASIVQPGDVVWDLGANIGFFTILAARLAGPAGRVVAFEPVPENIRALERNIALNHMEQVISVAPVAASDESGTAELALYDEPTWAKLNGVGSMKQDREPTGVIQVALVTLDSQLDTLPAPDVLKIDIEGAEAAALTGARRLLAEHRPIVLCELHGMNGPVADLLEQAGYTLDVVERPGTPVRDAPWNVHVLARAT